ncbi:MAG: O-antigen ligase family protein [Verrucomicrobiota bacterium JB024]|nr:O-antigen ligase family protein [Verrucomicrobiota bacterium JB024]
MPRPKKRTLQFRVFLIGELTLTNLLDWLITLLLGGILCFNIWQLGGARAETQLITAWMCGGLLLLHGLWFALCPQEGRYAFQKNALLLMPFLAYALLQWLVISPAPWEARGDFILVLEAFILFWVAIHNLRRRQHVWLLLAMICFFSALTILPAYNQAMRRPAWCPAIINPMDGQTYGVKLSAVFHGKAAGTMGSPAAFAGLMLLIISPLLVGAFCRRLTPPIRFLCFFLALMAMYALTLTQSLPALLAMTTGLLLCPFLLATKPKWKMYAFLCALLVPVLGLTYLYFTQSGFSALVNQALKGEYSDPRPALWLAGLKNFLAHPVTGQGMSSFGWLFELRRPEGFNFSPVYAHSAYLNFLGDFGLLGVLFVLPVFWMLTQAMRTLSAQPQFVLLEHPLKRKVVPNKRMFLSGVLMAFFAFGVQLFFEFNLRVPALLFIVAIYLAIMIKCLPTTIYHLSANKLTGPVCFAAAAVVTVGLLSIASPYLLGQAYAFESERLNETTIAALNERFTPEAETLEDALHFAQEAVTLDPNNPRLRTDLAEAILNQNFIHPAAHAEYGLLAEEQVRLALELSPEYLHAWIALGTALWMQGDYAGAQEAYRKGTEIAPNNAIPWYYLAASLNLEPGTRQQALVAIDRSLELDPSNTSSQQLRMKILIP